MAAQTPLTIPLILITFVWRLVQVMKRVVCHQNSLRFDIQDANADARMEPYLVCRFPVRESRGRLFGDRRPKQPDLEWSARRAADLLRRYCWESPAAQLSPIIPTGAIVHPRTYGCAQVNRPVSISELTSVSAPSIMVQMRKWRDGHEDPSTDFLLRIARRDMATLLIVLLVVFLLGGGGWGYARWRR